MTIRDKSELENRKIEIDLTGPDGNAFVLLGIARNLAEQMDLNWEVIQADMISGNYEHLLKVMDFHFGGLIDFYR